MANSSSQLWLTKGPILISVLVGALLIFLVFLTPVYVIINTSVGELIPAAARAVLARDGGGSSDGEGGAAGGGNEDLGFPPEADDEKTGNCLDGWMKGRVADSPLISLGPEFMSAGRSNRVNPGLLVAIGMSETSLATQGLATEGGHNFYGVTNPDGSFKSFPSWEASIQFMARYLATGYLYYEADPRTTIAAIGAVWAPVGAGNDPSNLNSHWVQNVTSYFKSVTTDCPELGTTIGVGGIPTSNDARELAKQILHHPKISLFNAHVSGIAEPASTAYSNIVDTAQGKQALRSSWSHPGSTPVNLSPVMLKAILAMGEKYSIRVIAIAGGKHGGNSDHYAGTAFDVDTINGQEVADISASLSDNVLGLCRSLDASQTLGPSNDPDGNHWHHVHCAF